MDVERFEEKMCPVRPATAAWLDRENPEKEESISLHIAGKGDFTFEGGRWYRHVQRTRPEWKEACQYHLFALARLPKMVMVLCKVPNVVTWKEECKAVRPILKSYGGGLSSRHGLVTEGMDAKFWQATKICYRYEWAKDKFVLVSKPTEAAGQ